MGVRSMLGRVMSVNILASSVADMVDGDRWLTGSRLSSSWGLECWCPHKVNNID